MPLTIAESARLVAAMKASREARERGDFAAAVAAYETAEAVEADARRREAGNPLEARVNLLEKRLHELGNRKPKVVVVKERA